MGSKNNPGAFDCYQNAEADEPMFVLLGRDKHAPTLVWLWSVLRELDRENPEKVKEARTCVTSMLEWQVAHQRKAVGIGQSALAALFELIRAANSAVPKANNSMTDEQIMRGFLCVTKFEKASEDAPVV